MGIEIERKFLVAGQGWRQAVRGQGVPMRQGYLSAPGPHAAHVRVRLAGAHAFLTIKGPALAGSSGQVRPEFEYPIPPEDAEGLLALCAAPPLVKTRYEVPHEGHVWTVDVFEAPAHFAGLMLAEVELPDVAVQPGLPDWLGAEVTDDPRYTNAALAIAKPQPGWGFAPPGGG
ncbi:CYTH domain-containing protein [Falsiroseomonas sp.]|uniref:CYTH domain-containing protein n=1 Tax=Falsiroseomonas sp. TaxID=2870721 RepID=UPI002723F979|nr:CYTH domain-containing protein [Falsiroseomonas sp.]MDO9501658.1 CYTH domain-containing protein [Falsiroseomonas sp.]MDP3416047.1 CYTH domain-containing protein [Falsiroseomonas sp.]